MSETMTGLKKDVETSRRRLQQLRDEVRVKLHLAGKDLKDQWNKLEPRLDEVEKAAKDLTEASRVSLVEAAKSVEKFLNSLGSNEHKIHHTK